MNGSFFLSPVDPTLELREKTDSRLLRQAMMNEMEVEESQEHQEVEQQAYLSIFYAATRPLKASGVELHEAQKMHAT